MRNRRGEGERGREGGGEERERERERLQLMQYTGVLARAQLLYICPHPSIHTHMYTLIHIHPLPSPHTAELSRPNINGKRSCSSAAVLNHGHSMAGDISYTSREMDVQMTLASPRHFLRRGGMVQDQLQDHLCSSKLAQVKTIYNLLVGCHT